VSFRHEERWVLETVVRKSIRHRWWVLLATLMLIVVGVRAAQRLAIDAVPDLTNVQVQILTRAPALGALDVERLVTVPVELAVTGLAHVREIRSLSRYGVSAVTVVFEDDVDSYAARQWMLERLVQARESVPAEYGVPELGPMTTGLGEVFQFEVRGEGRNLMELRTILDWEIAPRLRMVPGVVEINTFGGELKTYEILLSPESLVHHNIGLQEVFSALQRDNRIAGGGAIERGPHGVLLRADGLFQSLDDIRHTVLVSQQGATTRIQDIATVQFAPMLRQGAATRDGKGEAVVGMAMMRAGENSREVSVAVRVAVQRMNRTLPSGVRIEPFYDRTDLVQQTIRTVARSLLEGGVLVVVVLFFFLRDLRAGWIAACMVPLAMLGAFVLMRSLGVSGNLMSLGAIDFGLVVDGAIIVLENAIHHLSERRQALGRTLRRDEKDEVVLHSALEVRSVTAFGEMVIALVYVPILLLEGVEGKMFHPMALTVLGLLSTAFVLSLTFVPAMASLALSADCVDRANPVLVWLDRPYRWALEHAMRRPRVWVASGSLLLAAGAWGATSLGSEFVPRLNEGTLVLEARRLPQVSLGQSVRDGLRIESALLTHPSVQSVVTKTGRPEIANDPMGVEQSDVYVMLKPHARWGDEAEQQQLIGDLLQRATVAAPGVWFGVSQPIEMRMNELVSGVRSDFAVKVYGGDLHALARVGSDVMRVLTHVRGGVDVRMDRVAGAPVLRARIDRGAVAMRGARVPEVLSTLESVGGVTISTVMEHFARFPLRVRMNHTEPWSIAQLERLPVKVQSDRFLPLGDIAPLEVVHEPVVVQREATQRRLIVEANVRRRDLGGFAREAIKRIEREVRLPTGMRLQYGGQFENLARAQLRLMWVVPLTLLLIVAILYGALRAWGPLALVLLNVPFATLGGVAALLARGMPFSISAAVGFVAVFGVSVLNGMVLVSEIRRRLHAAEPRDRAIVGSARRRLRPVLTTASVATLGFLPMSIATGAGAEVQRPLATVVMGGLVASTLATLLVLPSLYALFLKKQDS
jgi:cobalt-zinc-cadmium resistance protein CzcA